MTTLKASEVMVTLPPMSADKFVVERDDHGGYVGGRCIICDGHGWANTSFGLPNGVHELDCPVYLALKAAGAKSAI